MNYFKILSFRRYVLPPPPRDVKLTLTEEKVQKTSSDSAEPVSSPDEDIADPIQKDTAAVDPSSEDVETSVQQPTDDNAAATAAATVAADIKIGDDPPYDSTML